MRHKVYTCVPRSVAGNLRYEHKFIGEIDADNREELDQRAKELFDAAGFKAPHFWRTTPS